MPAIKVAGNIEAEINNLLIGGNLADADLMAFEFIEELAEKNINLLADIDEVSIKDTLANYTNFLSVVDGILFERKNILLPRQANIFTTNYDLFIEKAASKLPNVTLNDGFDRTSTVGSRYLFSPEKYFDRTYRSGSANGRIAELPVLNLIKVHGSLSWHRDADKEIRFSSNGVSLSGHVQKNDPAAVSNALANRALILPNLRKFESTMLERVYFDLLRLFSNCMDRDNALLIAFGFSFADEHILDITRRALRNPTAQLLIFAYSSANVAAFSDKFSQNRNVAIVNPGTGAPTDFKVFNSILREVVPDGGKPL
ncbi:SIR2 family protein [Rhizobium changzhiense]|uniref:SIR2 family protein n=1 Tax=Rhizobium changzhiense TaxID=2692317 RepID=A0ABR6A858_9HYPH|nr:SIR2 family protein [Rhizobium changzhiense]MBA5802801.1 SIR2 family protein [Rhizobium changzhiense]